MTLQSTEVSFSRDSKSPRAIVPGAVHFILTCLRSLLLLFCVGASSADSTNTDRNAKYPDSTAPDSNSHDHTRLGQQLISELFLWCSLWNRVWWRIRRVHLLNSWSFVSRLCSRMPLVLTWYSRAESSVPAPTGSLSHQTNPSEAILEDGTTGPDTFTETSIEIGDNESERAKDEPGAFSDDDRQT